MNLLATEQYLSIAGEVLFPTRRRRIETFSVEGRTLRMLVLDRDEVVQRMPFYDFAPPIDGVAASRQLPFVARTVVRTTTAEERQPEPEGFQPSPYIEWPRFRDYAAFDALVTERNAKQQSDSRRRRRRVEKELGALSFVFDDPRPEVFDACVRWKSGQYLATGVGDMFAPPQNVELFRQLRKAGGLVVSSLSVGDKLMAVHFGAFYQGWFGSWIPAYDPALNVYSPGRLLLEELLKDSHARKHSEFDFLIGDEKYKFTYATHNRVIGPVGTPPLRDRLAKEAERRAKALLAKYPQAYQLARAVKRRLKRA
jgi:CelD/BcsL family acetyltransferase involved in cellulose biosynthesis